MRGWLMLGLLTISAASAQEFTRGVGVYPGNPREDFGPTLVTGGTAYRNLALHRPAYHSSSYDYNLTAQLVTDGIKDTRLPRWIATASSQQGALPRNERERFLDSHPYTSVDLKGNGGWVSLSILGGGEVPLIDRFDVFAQVLASGARPTQWVCVVKGSEDGQSWKELGRSTGPGRPANDFKVSIVLAQPSQSRYYRVEFSATGVMEWRIREVTPFNLGKRVSLGGPYDFTSAWMSAGQGEEWVYVDLGAESEFDRVALSWIRRAAEGAIQVSSDAAGWRTVAPLPSSSDEIKMAPPVKARYVRVLMTRPAATETYLLSELEVWGRGGIVARPKPAATDGRLAGGAWRVQRDSLVSAGGDALSRPGFDDRDWVPATVPGTTLNSYLRAGAVPDPDFGANQMMISDSFFYADFWYRNEFVAPKQAEGLRSWINFRGINWKAEVYLNGERLGRIEGGFMRGRFDVTGKLRPGGKNALAVRIEKNATPGSVHEKTLESPDKNGGALGGDNPTYHASIGWDWIPTIRGRNTGIWSDVSISTSGPVTVEDPLVSSKLPLPDATSVEITIETVLRNHEAKAIEGELRGTFGDVQFAVPVSLAASETKTLRNQLQLKNPKLWWPAGYGDANLYPVVLTFLVSGKTASDTNRFQAGVRQFTYSEDGGVLKMWINGRRFVARGGNWGFPESMLRYRAREYDIAVGYHRDMNFTMIRNWVGQIGDDEFYEACDRHGIVVWQDFWLANPADGPDPEDNSLFLRNARDTMLRIRKHASIGLYCGRNEGYPPKALEDGMQKLQDELHADLHYIPSSADGVVGGRGPYRALPPKYYADRSFPKLHSEMGMPNIPPIESVRAMMPESALWPQGREWGLHDFCLDGAQGGASFRKRIEESYGGAGDAVTWIGLAQFIDYEGHRAMYESQARDRLGLLIWMSHPAWPSFVWQTYDYYFEPTAGYFGAKKASEPLHIQWSPATNRVEVVNYSGGNATSLAARAEVLDMDGSLRWEKSVMLDSPEDSTVAPITMEYPAGLSPVHFLRLTLSRGSEVLSRNFYWRGVEEDNYRALPKAKVEAVTSSTRQGGVWRLTTELRNVSPTPALMIRLKVVRQKSGDRILPALFTDNYIALMRGEQRTIVTELDEADTRGETPRIVVEGFNVGN